MKIFPITNPTVVYLTLFYSSTIFDNLMFYKRSIWTLKSRCSIRESPSIERNCNKGAPPGVLGIWGEGLFIFRELGSTANYFRGAGEQAYTFGDLGSTAKK